MRYPLTPRSITLDDLELIAYQFEFLRELRGISQILEATTAK